MLESSDISREQFEKIHPILELARKYPKINDLYDVFFSIIYILKGKIQWRMLLKNYPEWPLCYYYFLVWSEKKTR